MIEENFDIDELEDKEVQLGLTKRVRILGDIHTHGKTTYVHGAVVELPRSAADYVISVGLAEETDDPLNLMVQSKKGR